MQKNIEKENLGIEIAGHSQPMKTYTGLAW